MNNHKKLKEILYSAIALTFIIWAVVYVQIKSSNVVKNTVPQQVDEMAIRKSSAINELKLAISSSTKVTDSQKTKALQDLKKAIDGLK
jgi:hypothetical protein